VDEVAVVIVTAIAVAAVVIIATIALGSLFAARVAKVEPVPEPVTQPAPQPVVWPVTQPAPQPVAWPVIPQGVEVDGPSRFELDLAAARHWQVNR
jgi:hypothetical protein